MKRSSKTLLLSCLLLLATGGLTRLSAQDATDPSDDIVQTTLLIVAQRTYTGTATKISASGAVTTGTFNLILQPRGFLSASATFDGVTTSYNGEVARTSLGERRLNGSGYLRVLPAPIAVTIGTSTVVFTTPNGNTFTLPAGTTPVSGGVIHSAAVQKIPVVITPGAAYGGLQDEDGSSLVFRGARQLATTDN